MSATQEMGKVLDAFLAKHNPCDIKPNRNGGVDCNGGHGCCQGCAHLGKGGCQVTSISCKFWLCDSAWVKLSFTAQLELYALLWAWDEKLFQRYDGREVDRYQAFNHQLPGFAQHEVRHFAHDFFDPYIWLGWDWRGQ